MANELYFRSTGTGTSDIELTRDGETTNTLVGGLRSPLPRTGGVHVVELNDGTRKEFTSAFAAREWLRGFFNAI